MIVKNKLYKHHKNKAVLLVRNFTVAFSLGFAVIALAAIPTYISAYQISETKAIESSKNSGAEENNATENNDVLTSNLD